MLMSKRCTNAAGSEVVGLALWPIYITGYDLHVWAAWAREARLGHGDWKDLSVLPERGDKIVR